MISPCGNSGQNLPMAWYLRCSGSIRHVRFRPDQHLFIFDARSSSLHKKKRQRTNISSEYRTVGVGRNGVENHALLFPCSGNPEQTVEDWSAKHAKNIFLCDERENASLAPRRGRLCAILHHFRSPLGLSGPTPPRARDSGGRSDKFYFKVPWTMSTTRLAADSTGSSASSSCSHVAARPRWANSPS